MKDKADFVNSITNLPKMECKKLLWEAEGDVIKAIEISYSKDFSVGKLDAKNMKAHTNEWWENLSEEDKQSVVNNLNV